MKNMKYNRMKKPRRSCPMLNDCWFERSRIKDMILIETSVLYNCKGQKYIFVTLRVFFWCKGYLFVVTCY